jgi:hypothetical protein
MNLEEEKAVIYSMMQDITQERRKLTDMYLDLQARANEINRLQALGLDEVGVATHIKAHNTMQVKQIKENIERESSNAITRLQNNLNIIEKPKEVEQKSVIPKIEIEREKDKLPKKASQLSIDKLAGGIASVLKSYGSPMSVKDLHEKLQAELDIEITTNNFRNNVLPRSCKKNSNIQRAMRGYYQYVRSD